MNLRTITPRTTSRWSSDFCLVEAGAEGGAGGAEGGGGGTGEGGGGPPAAFYETFTNEALKTSPVVQKFKSVQDLAEGYVNLEKRYGIDPARRIDLPADPNDKDGMRAVFAKLGLPEKPEGYGFKLDDKAPEADKAMLAAFTAKAHELGLPAGQAKGVMDFWLAQVAGAEKAQADAFAAQAASGKAELQKEWGQAYDQRAKEIGLLLNKHGDAALIAELDGDKLGNYPNLARFIGKLVDAMAEPGVAGGGSGDADTGAGRALTPAQAKGAVAALEGDPVKGVALRDRAHPQHKAVVEERQRLLAQAG